MHHRHSPATHRSVWILAIALVLGGYLSGLARGGAAAEISPAKVAVVDLEKLLNGIDEAKDKQADLESMRLQLVDEEQRRRDEIARLQEDLKVVREAEVPAKQKEIRRRSAELEAWIKIEGADLDGARADAMEQLYLRTVGAIEAFAGKHGIDVVLFKDATGPFSTRTRPELLLQLTQRKLLYSAPTLEITDELMQKMNRDYVHR